MIEPFDWNLSFGGSVDFFSVTVNDFGTDGFYVELKNSVKQLNYEIKTNHLNIISYAFSKVAMFNFPI
jgi:hypothetical protein